jgi:hypothetical protein
VASTVVGIGDGTDACSGVFAADYIRYCIGRVAAGYTKLLVAEVQLVRVCTGGGRSFLEAGMKVLDQ